MRVVRNMIISLGISFLFSLPAIILFFDDLIPRMMLGVPSAIYGWIISLLIIQNLENKEVSKIESSKEIHE